MGPNKKKKIINFDILQLNKELAIMYKVNTPFFWLSARSPGKQTGILDPLWKGWVCKKLPVFDGCVTCIWCQGPG